MTKNEPALAARVQLSFTKLSDTAARLNAATDQVGTLVADLDATLKYLNLGVSAWVTFLRLAADDEGMSFWHHRLGYTKLNGKWGLAINLYQENAFNDTTDRDETWFFNDAPRELRLKALDGIPDLIDKLTKEAEKLATTVIQRLDETKELAFAIETIAVNSGLKSGKRNAK